MNCELDFVATGFLLRAELNKAPSHSSNKIGNCSAFNPSGSPFSLRLCLGLAYVDSLLKIKQHFEQREAQVRRGRRRS
jgi:hypothetical protein